MKHSLLFLVSILVQSVNAQQLTSQEVLDRAIAFHDPENHWRTFSGTMRIDMETPNSGLRSTVLELDFPEQYFKTTVTKDNTTIESELAKGECTLKLNGDTNIPTKLKDSLKISCDRAKRMKNYYTYLYGLPMKLKDPGTLLDDRVLKKTFKGKEYLVLKATYAQDVGEDTWYYYFDPKTFAMEVYQFYHDESKNDGEFILLSELLTVNDIKLPKVRAWYYNKDEKYLGTDILKSATSKK